MIKFLAHSYINIAHVLDMLQLHVHYKGDYVPSPEARQDLISRLEWLQNDLTLHGFTMSEKTAGRLKDSLAYMPIDATVRGTMTELARRINDEIEPQLFMHIPTNDASWFEKKEAFGHDISLAFPLAINDIEESGNCYATGRYTASVFHLMRAVEWGLRTFCSHLGFRKVRKGKKDKYVPVSHAEWDRILNQLEGPISKKIDKYKPGIKKQEAQEFYNSIIQDIRAIKDAWRNHVMHTRVDYEKEDVDSIRAHVKRLFILLSSRISKPKPSGAHHE